MDLLSLLRRGEYGTYLIVLFLTVLLLLLSLYLAFFRLVDLFTAATTHPETLAQAIYNALSDVFLVIVFIELIDTFITYVEEKQIVVYKIIDVALVALARELFIYLAPANQDFKLEKGAVLVAAAFVIGIIDYLQRIAPRAERRRR
jgi:uncharacterized membrane protein (DUF373 family)